MQQGLQKRLKNCKRIRTDQTSVYLQKVQCQQLEQRLKQAEAWLLQMGQLARLVDYMICQNLVSIIEEKITSFVANILQVRWWVGCGKAGRQSGADWRETSTDCSPTTSPDLSLQAPRQKPFLSAQLVFDSHGQLSHEPCIENMIQILTAGLSSMKASALKVFWLGQGAGWRNSLQGIPCFYPLESESSQPGPNPHCLLFLPLLCTLA